MAKLLHALEAFFTNYIEGFFNKGKDTGLQPVELAKKLVKEMENQRSVGVANIYVPNHYTVFLTPPDYERIAPYGQTIADEIAAYLAKQANQRGYVMPGRPKVEFIPDEKLQQGQFRFASRFTVVSPSENIVEKMGDLSETKVYKKLSPLEVACKSVPLTGMITVVEGLDVGLKADVGVNRVNIGRREGNELPLTDMNTSRLHAYIVYEEGAHVIYDARSLNGTYVNGHRITRKKLRSGDRIKVGNSLILYEVN
ncbi:FhaA domain-containing protein [Sporolituus thermophilus]|uniref:FHA domain-containing protein n=1 Tax=Sporolituus thermophilus DSM 23256 TaxID=1123285 RepID=A0A1G7KSW7_9FIRM|nr:DUF3662 and FHA domain-containing protein [Sporolituus thermophilus]SDF40313.1 FHA domain-containing protein [Sporolituus thermophilus DSM 23256]